MSRRVRTAATAAVLGVVVLAGGCREQAAPPDAAIASAERGPITFTVTATPAELLLGDRVTVELVARAPAELAVALPDAAALPALLAEEAGPVALAELEDGRRAWRRTLTIEPQASGPVELPQLVMRYGRASTDDGLPTLDHELATEPPKLQVRSVLGEGDSPDRPRDITALLEVRRPRPRWWWPALIGGGLGALAIAAAFAWVVARRLSRPAPPESPEAWARRVLAELAAADLPASGRMREYYYALSEIVRGFIERRYGIAAPEMTTAEFLSAVGRDGHGLPPGQADHLRGWLEACDAVKYAAYAPDRAAADEAFVTARAFVDAAASPPPATAEAVS